MRKAVLGSIAAITAGAGVASAQGFVAPPPLADVQPASGNGPVIPPYQGGDPGVMPMPQSAPNGAPVYPPPGFYGANPGPAPSDDCPPGRVVAPNWWLNSEYLYWFGRAQPSMGALLTTSARADAGRIGNSTTSVIIGNRELGYNQFSGFRITGGYWRGDDRRVGMEFSGFATEQRGNFTFVQSNANGIPLIARPFTDAVTGGQGAILVSSPTENGQGSFQGSALVATTSQTFGAEANVALNLFRSDPADAGLMTVTALAGFRYLDLNEILTISSASTLIGNQTERFATQEVRAPATIGIRDMFETNNRLYAGQLGLKSEVRYRKGYISFTGKVAFGLMNQILDVDGRSEVLDPTRGVAAVSPGGLYANSAMNGRRRNDEFAVVPEGIVRFGYNWSSWLTSYVGYSVLYTSRVIRPGEQYTQVVNVALLPTSPSFGNGGVVPVRDPAFTQTEFWLQGVSFGLEMKY